MKMEDSYDRVKSSIKRTNAEDRVDVRTRDEGYKVAYVMRLHKSRRHRGFYPKFYGPWEQKTLRGKLKVFHYNSCNRPVASLVVSSS